LGEFFQGKKKKKKKKGEGPEKKKKKQKKKCGGGPQTVGGCPAGAGGGGARGLYQKQTAPFFFISVRDWRGPPETGGRKKKGETGQFPKKTKKKKREEIYPQKRVG